MMTDTTLRTVSDPHMGCIAAVIDRDGTILSTGATSPEPLQVADLGRYIEQSNLAVRELADLELEERPWVDREAWERCIHRGWVDGSEDCR